MTREMNPDGPFDRLVRVVDRLRGPDGCPWDRKQTRETLRRFLLEETHEVLDALEQGEPEAIREELGDLLLQVVFQARIGKERNEFDIADVCRTIADKMVRRHPHVFGDEDADDAAWVTGRWEEMKREERQKRGGAPDDPGVPTSLPALLRAQVLNEKGRDASPTVDDLRDSARGLGEAWTTDESATTLSRQIGRHLETVVALAAERDLSAETCLRDWLKMKWDETEKEHDE